MVDQSKIKAARGPLTAVLVLGVVMSWVLLAPRPKNADDANVESGDSTLVVPTTPAPVTTAVDTTLPETTTNLPAAIGGLSPEWPEWVQVESADKTASSYTATLNLTEGGMRELLVWLSMQRWVLSSDSPEATVWSLAAGRATGTLESTLDGRFIFTVAK